MGKRRGRDIVAKHNNLVNRTIKLSFNEQATQGTASP